MVAHVHFARLTGGGGQFFPDEVHYLQQLRVFVCGGHSGRQCSTTYDT